MSELIKNAIQQNAKQNSKTGCLLPDQFTYLIRTENNPKYNPISPQKLIKFINDNWFSPGEIIDYIHNNPGKDNITLIKAIRINQDQV